MTGAAPVVTAPAGPTPTALAGSRPAGDVLADLGSGAGGLDEAEVARRREQVGPNAVRTHRVSALGVLGRQLRSALLALLLIAAAVSFFVGERTDAIVIGAILAVSVILGFANEYRAERAGAALHDRIRHDVVVVRGGRQRSVDVVDLVPGDVVQVALGMVVPADLRLLEVQRLECDESVLTGESVSVAKQVDPVTPDAPLGDLASCALMGTIVRAGSGTGVVVATGAATTFGRIALGLSERHPETEFQAGLRHFSMLLARVAAALTVFIFVINLVLHRPILDAVLFSLAIAVGITPQLLPAIVTTSLAAGSRRLAAAKVLVKRLVCVEDLGNVEVLFTDKTGTLTDGRISYQRSHPVAGQADPLLLGLLANEASVQDGTPVGGNPLDRALWEAPAATTRPVATYRRVALLPFDHERRRTSVLVDGPDGRMLVAKGAPEELLARCVEVPGDARAGLDTELAGGARVIAVASRPVPGQIALTPDDERDLTLAGILVFRDAPKPDARPALEQLARLGVTVKVITGDHPAVAVRVCEELGLPVTGVRTGADVAALDDRALREALAGTTVFARVGPDDKARIVRAQRVAGADVAFLGDGVNDAVALHAADVGISVDSATDVAKDAADVLLLEKDLGVLAGGVTEGRRIFANTIKYVLMGTSSNFGNMFSAAGASAFLPFLPMLPSQILLNNLIYDLSQVAIPADRVDPEQLARPAHWDLREIRRFMLTFGPVSSLFDFLTFAILLSVLHAGPVEFRSGWFVESLATQTLVVFVIRTHRTPPWRSRPSRALAGAVVAAVAAAALLPYTPLAGPLGFTALPPVFQLVLAGLVAAYLALVEGVKRMLLTSQDLLRSPAPRTDRAGRRLHRRAARFTSQQRTAVTAAGSASPPRRRTGRSTGQRRR
ncbi:magnesium-translocating P-type ATPase [Planosporangium thailandense]|uniref:Magnesium-transporting ATPase, P-type 1 n=1 Tax=Planosporangium thailandense TaxID=765197 RepID=A0ABX0Y4X3_9ACTN|nr:magnesium-translocating P-type ATPase [Planosporangium thailandense]NJC72447.1 magnesium-translocating P-type ATPase [Planosporangium thailandense]